MGKGKIYISAGEESGDLHGAGLLRALKKIDAGLVFAGMGGDRMAAAGMDVIVHARTHGVVGLAEFAGRVLKLKKDLDKISAAMARDGTAFIAVDYGGFNVRLLARAKRLGLKTFYYIPPKIWAWGRHRSKVISRNADLILAIFPFEKAFWEAAGAEVVFVGHPLNDLRIGEGAVFGEDKSNNLLLVMPGSRISEIKGIWPVVAASLNVLRRRVRRLDIVVAPAGFTARDLGRYAPVPADVTVVEGGARPWMKKADAAVAASGTAALELALADVPALILYRVNRVTWEVGRRLVYVSHLGLPNVIAGETVVPELLQSDVSVARVAELTAALLENADLREAVRKGYAEVRAAIVGDDGITAAERAAREIYAKL